MAPLDHPNGSVEIAPNLTQLWGADNTDTGQSRVQFWSVNLCVVLNALAAFDNALFLSKQFQQNRTQIFFSMQSWDYVYLCHVNTEQITQSKCATTAFISLRLPTFIYGHGQGHITVQG